MDRLIEHLSTEWHALAQAPFAFLIMAVLMLVAAYALARWRYGAIVEQLRTTNEILRERIHLKDEQVGHYRARALQLEDKHAEVVDTTEEGLRDKALSVARGVREIMEKYRPSYEQAMASIKERDIEDNGEEQQAEGVADPLMHVLGMAIAEYSRAYKIDAILLRDELRSRLAEYRPDPMCHDMLYEYPTNYFGLEDVATDLERMAKMLTNASS